MMPISTSLTPGKRDTAPRTLVAQEAQSIPDTVQSHRVMPGSFVIVIILSSAESRAVAIIDSEVYSL